MDNNLTPQEQQTAPRPVIYAQQPQPAPARPVIPNRGKGLALGIVGMFLGISSAVLILYCALTLLNRPGSLEELVFVIDELIYGVSNGTFDFLDFIYYYEVIIPVLIYTLFSGVYAVVSLILSLKGRAVLKTKVSAAGIVLSTISLGAIALMILFVTVAIMA